VSDARVTRQGLEGVRPGREAPATYSTRRRGAGSGERPTVPDADFRSYYGLPVLNRPVWESPDIPGYLYLGGLAGGASLLAAAASLRHERELARVGKVGAAVSASLSLVALVHDLGRPARFLNMLRVFKVTSPMSVGSWLLAAYVPAAVGSAASDVTGRLRPVGAAATGGAALLAPAVASYTAALITDTAVPAWHDGYREMPYLFVGSGAMAAGGLGLLAAPATQQGLPRRMALLGAAGELAASEVMERRLGMVGEPYHQGRGGRLMRAGKVLALAGGAATVLSRRRPWLSALSGMALMAASALTRFGIFEAGMASADDPRYTVEPQRERLRRGEATAREQED
jgi:hypothetical protein